MVKAIRQLLNMGCIYFYVINEIALESGAHFLDSITEIGEIEGIKYYYATRTDSSLGALSDIIDGNCNLEGGEEELQLIKTDYEKMS